VNYLCRLLGIDIPIIQAPVGSIAGPELAAAVSDAGGLGGLGLTWTNLEASAKHVTLIRSATDRPFFVNFALVFEPESLESALEAGAPVVTFSWGDSEVHIQTVRRFGAMVGIQVGNAEGASRAQDRGADFIICQGIEAGGHVQSTIALERVMHDVLDAAGSIPVIAAGGIADGAGIARAMKLGAQGAMLGTRFVATQESRAHPAYKQKLVDSESGDTALTICFDGGWPFAPHRVLRNRTLDRWEAAGCQQPGLRPGEGESVGFTEAGEAIPRYEDTAPRVGMTGDVAEMAFYAGTGVGGIQEILSAGDLVRQLWTEAIKEGV